MHVSNGWDEEFSGCSAVREHNKLIQFRETAIYQSYKAISIPRGATIVRHFHCMLTFNRLGRGENSAGEPLLVDAAVLISKADLCLK